MFKQFMQAKAFEYCQIDSARIGGVNEILVVYLMAKKLNIKCCPHAGNYKVSSGQSLDLNNKITFKVALD